MISLVNSIPIIQVSQVMINIMIKMRVTSAKQKELLQTIQAVGELTRNENGCLNYHIYRDIENEDTFSLIESWKSTTDFNKRVKSKTFSVLLGAVNVLSESTELNLGQTSYSGGIEMFKLAKDLPAEGAKLKNKSTTD
jgi:quinol monooxygenase YgiN